MKPRSKSSVANLPRAVLIGATLLTIAACAETQLVQGPVLPVELPAAPEFCKPEPLPAAKQGVLAKLALSKRTADAQKANDKLEQCEKWYSCNRERYAGRPVTEECKSRLETAAAKK